MPPSGPEVARALRGADLDLLAWAEERDRRLARILSLCHRYRGVLRPNLTRLRQGAEPGPIRGALDLWEPLIHELRRVTRGV